jgi:hypothetical protein
VPCFFLAAPVLRRVQNTPLVLALVLLAYVVRLWYYSELVDPWYTLPAELLHGIQFSFGWAATTQHVATLLPPEYASTAQGAW